MLCGGFPCQDISLANSYAEGLAGNKSGLWYEYLKTIENYQPECAVIENVAKGQTWVPTVRSGLYRVGYSSVRIQVRACDIGAPHERIREFVVAYPHGYRESTSAVNAEARTLSYPANACRFDWRNAPADALGVANGFSSRLDRARLTMTGNAVLPQVSERLGYIIKNWLGWE